MISGSSSRRLPVRRPVASGRRWEACPRRGDERTSSGGDGAMTPTLVIDERPVDYGKCSICGLDRVECVRVLNAKTTEPIKTIRLIPTPRVR
jgi:hypothetical protein